MSNKVLGVEIKFRPVVGNMDHIKIMENLSEIFDMRKRYEGAVDSGRAADKIYEDIGQLEERTRSMIASANNQNKIF